MNTTKRPLRVYRSRALIPALDFPAMEKQIVGGLTGSVKG